MNSESYSHLQGTYTRQASTIQSPPQGGIEHNPGLHSRLPGLD